MDNLPFTGVALPEALGVEGGGQEHIRSENGESILNCLILLTPIDQKSCKFGQYRKSD